MKFHIDTVEEYNYVILTDLSDVFLAVRRAMDAQFSFCFIGQYNIQPELKPVVVASPIKKKMN